jgi:predicted aspartyl protease
VIELKINFKNHNVSVPIYIWDKTRERFYKIEALFDTGAHTCAIDKEAFFNLGYDLDNAKKSYISTATQSNERVNRVIIDKMKLGDAEFNSVLFNTFDFPLTSPQILIGMNVIRHFKVTMDFREQLITMCDNYMDNDDGYNNANIFGDWRADSKN